MECIHFFLLLKGDNKNRRGLLGGNKPISRLYGTGRGRIFFFSHQPGIPGGHGTSSYRSTGDGFADSELKFYLLGLQWRGQKSGVRENIAQKHPFPQKSCLLSCFSACFVFTLLPAMLSANGMVGKWGRVRERRTQEWLEDLFPSLCCTLPPQQGTTKQGFLIFGRMEPFTWGRRAWTVKPYGSW